MKKELSATERRLNARNDRIYQLEQLVTGQEHKLNQREQRYNEELAALKRQVTLGKSCFSFVLPLSSRRSRTHTLENTSAGVY